MTEGAGGCAEEPGGGDECDGRSGGEVRMSSRNEKERKGGSPVMKEAGRSARQEGTSEGGR